MPTRSRLRPELSGQALHARRASAVHILLTRYGYSVSDLAAIFKTTAEPIRKLAARGLRDDGQRIVVVCPSEEEFRTWLRDTVKLPEWAARRARDEKDAHGLSNFILVAWGVSRWTLPSMRAHDALMHKVRQGLGSLPRLEIPTPP